MKKTRFYLLSLMVLMFACTNDNKTSGSPAEHQDSMANNSVESDRLNSPPFSVEINESTQQLKLIRSSESLHKVSATGIVEAINRKYSGIRLELVPSIKDTVQLKIADATELTQQMGSTGAEAYLAEVTFSLTELKGIKAVRFDFTEGDHAQPGVYTRANFKAYK